jgi:glycosyltransferase involved in cell wall biosynthesis
MEAHTALAAEDRRGSRLKILEALSMGRAVVSTSVGAEGLDVEHDRHILLADDAQAFSASVLRLLSDPRRCLTLAVEGRRLVEQSYGWDALAHKMAGFVQEIIGDGISSSVPDRASAPTA